MLKWLLASAGILVAAFLAYIFWTPVPDKAPQPANISEAPASTDVSVRIGQMLLVGFRGMSAEENPLISQQLQELSLGGIILFDRDLPSGGARNIKDAAQVRALIQDLQSVVKVPLFVSIDAEGGRVNRLAPRYGFLNVPSHSELGQQTEANTEMTAEKLGEQLARLGINMNFAPVADVNVNPQNPIIGGLGRSFSADPERVAKHAAAFIRGQEKQGIVSVLKHFPGHGSSKGDTHLDLVDVTSSYKDYELSPFRALAMKTPAIMTAHVLNRKMDPVHPATLSPAIISQMLRKDIGFQGVIVSDDMQMGAIVQQYGFEEALVRAVNAGVDIIVLSNNIRTYDPELPEKAHATILAAVRSGAIPETRINEAYDRIMNLKKQFALVP